MTTISQNVCTRRPGSRWSGCDCPDCQRLNSHTRKRLYAGKRPGPSMAATWAALDRMLDRGLQSADVAHASGVDRETLTAAMRRRASGADVQITYINRVRIIEASQRDIVPAQVPAFGAARRMQALARRGWTLNTIAPIIGFPVVTLLDIRSGKSQTTRREVVERIKEVYDDLWDKVPYGSASGMTQSRNHAEAMNWAPPLMWDDEALDDPDGQPWTEEDYWVQCGQCDGTGHLRRIPTRKCPGCAGKGTKPSRRTRKNAIDMDDLRLLASAGSNWEDLGKRLGVDPESVQSRLHRDGERALLRTISLNSIKDAQDVDAADLYRRTRNAS